MYPVGADVYQTDISSLPHNFYDKNGTKETKNDLSGKTYTWNADVDSGIEGNQSGWKANS